jgi:hypothetical protein
VNVNAPMRRTSVGIEEQIAEDALRSALLDWCSPGSWRGIARSLAWRLIANGDRDPRTIELLSGCAEEILAGSIDDALWTVQQTVRTSLEEYARERPGDAQGALAAARLDAREESVGLIVAACERVLDLLQRPGRRAA